MHSTYVHRVPFFIVVKYKSLFRKAKRLDFEVILKKYQKNFTTIEMHIKSNYSFYLSYGYNKNQSRLHLAREKYLDKETVKR